MHVCAFVKVQSLCSVCKVSSHCRGNVAGAVVVYVGVVVVRGCWKSMWKEAQPGLRITQLLSYKGV